jgi:hypothetical protein
MTTGPDVLGAPRTVAQCGLDGHDFPQEYIFESRLVLPAVLDVVGWLQAGVSEFHQYLAGKGLSSCPGLEQHLGDGGRPSVGPSQKPNVPRSPATLDRGIQFSMINLHSRPLTHPVSVWLNLYTLLILLQAR